MLFVMGVMLAMGVMTETGIVAWIAQFLEKEVHNVWLLGTMAGVMSLVVDEFMSAMSMISLFPVVETGSTLQHLSADFAQNGLYWKIVAYASAMGSNVFGIGSMCGLAYMKTERVRVNWYFRNVGMKCVVGALIGLAVMWAMNI